MKKINKSNEKRNKKKLLIVTGISALTILGGTLAYFTTHTEIGSLIKTALYQHNVVKTFEAPEDWQPGETLNTSFTITNTGNVDMALRAKYTEKWTSANGNDLPTTKGNFNVAIIAREAHWIPGDNGYYYYRNVNGNIPLKPNETSPSFIEKITLLDGTEATLDKTVSDDGNTITYTSSGRGYDNATYTLTIQFETIQFDQADNIW
ncbi:MAG: hypothetical protein E7166_05505 [Firmicutes bacterium]|nr:hypothetical protein [Bacillota bacterium]